MFKEIAKYYDLIMSEFDYQKLVDYLDDLIIGSGGERTNLLDIACGTAEELIYFRQLGYEVAGLDNSKEMLKIAKEKHYLIDFFHDDMTNFKLNKKFDNVICTFDSVNYVTDEKKLLKCFKAVYSTLNTKGLFLFDFNTLYGLLSEWEGIRTEEHQDFYIIYETVFNYDNLIADIEIKTFIKQDEKYIHFTELHREKAYNKTMIKNLLTEAGFYQIKFLPFLKKKPETGSKFDRYQVVAKKK